jgi:hypothetical protein
VALTGYSQRLDKQPTSQRLSTFARDYGLIRFATPATADRDIAASGGLAGVHPLGILGAQRVWDCVAASTHSVEFRSLPAGDSALSFLYVGTAGNASAVIAGSRSGTTAQGVEFLDTAGTVSVRFRSSAGSNRTASGAAVSANQLHAYLLTWDGTTGRLYIDGRPFGTFTDSGTVTHSQALRIARRNADYATTKAASAAFFRRALSEKDALRITQTPSAAYSLLFEPRRFAVPAAAGAGSTGTVATTNAADTSSATGTTTVTGTSATTNAADTSNAAGTTTVTGTLATTNADDTAAASGAVGGDITGSSATTNANDAGAASGTTTIVGASATTNADDASSAAGTTTVVGTSATTNADDTATASGVAGAITGTSATTNADDTASAEGYPGDEPPAVAVVKRGGGSNFVKARKRLAVEYLIEYLTEEEPSAETKRVIAEIKAGRPVPADAKPPSAARSLSVADLAEKIIPRRLMSYQNLIVDAIEPQRVIARAVRIAEEREDEDLLMLL